MRGEKSKAESQFYQVIFEWLRKLLEQRFSTCYLEITAGKKFSERLKALIPDHRGIIFHFLNQAAPDITGFVKDEYSLEFVVVEIKTEKIKLEDVYQTKKYAELFDAPYALLISTSQIPEEIKRLYKVAPSVLSTMAGYRRITLASFIKHDGGLSVELFPDDPFEKMA